MQDMEKIRLQLTAVIEGATIEELYLTNTYLYCMKWTRCHTGQIPEADCILQLIADITAGRSSGGRAEVITLTNKAAALIASYQLRQ